MKLKTTIAVAGAVLLAGCAATTGTTVTVVEPSWETSSAKKVHVIRQGKTQPMRRTFGLQPTVWPRLNAAPNKPWEMFSKSSKSSWTRPRNTPTN